MIVGGSVSGRILDMNGLGLANVRVSTAQPIYLSNGKRDFGRSTAGAQTDDRGDYRVRGLRPGIYYLRADVDFWASDSATYYPGVKDQSGAVSITVRENQESTANFRVEPRLKTVLTVSGQILIATRDGGSTYYDNRADDMSNGRFEIRNIFPDVYDLFPDARDKDGVLYTSRTTVELVDRNIENLTLTAAPLVQTQGKVTLNGSPPAGRLEGVTLSLEVVRGLQPFLTATEDFRGPAPITPHAESGEFLTDRLAPGVYKVNAAKLPPDVYLEDLRQGPLSVYTNGFEITDRAGEPVEVLLAGPGGKLDGVVRNIRQEPASRVTVVLVPDPTRRQDRRRYLTVPTDNDGKFTLRAIPPGTYKAFVWEAVPGSAWLNAEFMQKYESRGETVAISKGSAVTVQLTLIPREPEQ
jgi:hypothetical protein